MAALKSILSSRVSKCIGHTIATIFLPRSYCQTYPDIPWWGFVFQQDGALAHRARDTIAFLERKVPDFISPTLWPPNSPIWTQSTIASAWSVLPLKVYRSTIAIGQRTQFICVWSTRGDALSSWSWMLLWAKGAVISALMSVERGTLWAPSIKLQLFCHVSTKSY